MKTAKPLIRGFTGKKGLGLAFKRMEMGLGDEVITLGVFFLADEVEVFGLLAEDLGHILSPEVASGPFELVGMKKTDQISSPSFK